MNVEIKLICADEEEKLLIRCYAITDEIREIADFAKSRQGKLSGSIEEKRYEVPYSEIHYIESVDGKTFLYTGDNVYASNYRLYELEELLRPKWFLRISKGMLVNLMKITSIQPALNGRFSINLKSGEEVIVSRSYVKELKAALKGT